MPASFCYGATENLPVGLLVTGYGLTLSVVSVPLIRLTAKMPRRVLLPSLLAVFVVTTWISVAAAAYWMLLGARVVMALSQAIFWPVPFIVAAALAAALTERLPPPPLPVAGGNPPAPDAAS